MKRGPKTGATITRIIDRRDIIEKAYLELYITNCLDVSPENGLTTLARFLYKNEKFLKNNGKQIAVNTIRQELTDIGQRMRLQKPKR